MGTRNVTLLIAILLASCSSSPPEKTRSSDGISPAVRIPLIEIINFREMGGGDKPMDWTATPIISSDPSQADEGSYQYWLVCMSCHGERGQGLTDEWRVQWGLEEQNCWQSKCHASNFPPGGFVLPKYAPVLIGETALLRFQTALELHDYLALTMPWWAPGSLTDDVYWQLTAFLLRENGVEFDIFLEERNAAMVIIPPMNP